MTRHKLKSSFLIFDIINKKTLLSMTAVIKDVKSSGYTREIFALKAYKDYIHLTDPILISLTVFTRPSCIYKTI